MHVCSIYKIKGIFHFNIAHTHESISLSLKASSLTFCLSGCSDPSPNLKDIPLLPERGTTALMHSNQDEARHFCVYSCFLSVYCVYLYLWIYCIMFFMKQETWPNIFQKCSLTSQAHTKKSNSTELMDIIVGFLISTDKTRISTMRNLSHTVLNTNHCSIPCASDRQKMNPLKKIKRQIMSMSHTTVKLLDPSE